MLTQLKFNSHRLQLFAGCATSGSSTRPPLTAEQFNRARWEEIVAQAAGSEWEVMAKADRWSQEVGWEPGPSDA